jgi:hypothetical protein
LQAEIKCPGNSSLVHNRPIQNDKLHEFCKIGKRPLREFAGS